MSIGFRPLLTRIISYLDIKNTDTVTIKTVSVPF